MSTDTNVQSMTKEVEKIFEATNTVVSGMNDGEHKTIVELSTDVGTALSLEPKKVLGFVSFYAHHTDIAYVARGKNGGLVKGTRPVKVVKAGKKNKSQVDTDTNQ